MQSETKRGENPHGQERTDSKQAVDQNVSGLEPDLTSFQEQILTEIATHAQTHGHYPYGLAIKERLEVFHGTKVNHGRLYPNLNELQERGLVEKHERDRRTNEYHLTDAGYDVLEDRLGRLKKAVGGGDA